LVGKSAVFHGENDKYVLNNNILRIRFSSQINSDFVNFMLNSDVGKKQIASLVAGTTSVAAIYQKEFLSIKIPLPDIDTQRAIVAQIEEEQRLVNANKELIKLFEVKVKATINRVWGEETATTISAERPEEFISLASKIRSAS
jgi:type I restriction enzyme M protein